MDGISPARTGIATGVTTKKAKNAPIKKKSKPMWLEIIHEGNIKNILDTRSVPLLRSKRAGPFRLKVKISLKNTILALFKYTKLKLLLARAAFLRTLGIYYFLKRVFKNK